MDSTILECKLNSKTAALTVLTEELEKCRIERDHYKIILENQVFHNTYNSNSQGLNYDKLLSKLREENKLLRLETEDIRQKLRDAQGDNQVLRAGGFVKDCINTILISTNGKEELVKNLEIINSKYQQLKLDFALLLDDKQELIIERDGFRKKIKRLNSELGAALNVNKKQPVIDIDSILSENKYLNERLRLEVAEKDIVTKNKTFFQNLSNSNQKMSLSNITNSSLTRKVAACKQMQQILESGNLQALFSNSTTLADMRKLCQTLFEALQDKTLALNHQKKTNKILAKRLEDLEKQIKSINQGEAILSPSQVLLDKCNMSTSDDTDSDASLNEEFDESPNSNEDNHSIYNLNLDQFPNDVSTLPSNIQQLVSDAMNTTTNNPLNSPSNDLCSMAKNVH
ncbi:coiled-coil domain-containing protein 149 [Adelges cooleyi]|uniref:coiled-coil domain-containing protein 149 n=1 Tax=Adelges cooleyi TaxID=133065 RepID=UPI002180076A|nr:coiled-coil domain-containing protein 149 [Adelges cooleyi]XP_050430256.1 coiled-coil domain-containing protein 149 [Adelges cooleyi]